MKTGIYLLSFLLWSISTVVAASEIKVLSPDKLLELRIQTDKGVSVKLFSGADEIFQINDIKLVTDRGDIPSANAKVRHVKRASVNRIIKPVIKEKKAEIPEMYNEAVIEFKDKSKIQFRVYNDGAVYRFVTDLPGELKIFEDRADFVFDENASLIFQKDNNNPNSDYEKPYITSKINDLAANDMGNLPALVRNSSGNFVLFMEADTKDYPCMWIKKTENGLSTYYFGYPAGYNVKGNFKNRRAVTKSEDFIAKTSASREFPWKVFADEYEAFDELYPAALTFPHTTVNVLERSGHSGYIEGPGGCCNISENLSKMHTDPRLSIIGLFQMKPNLIWA